jgi:hypothetical protein
MKLSDLNAEQLDKLFSYQYDRIVEKHKGPWDWEGILIQAFSPSVSAYPVRHGFWRRYMTDYRKLGTP